MTFAKERLKEFSTGPGVYQMLSRSGKILYIGKAKNLRSRVRQYFLKGGDGRAMIPQLMAQVDDIETILVRSEKEALLLENTLIKKHKPKYNVLLKDDKTYISLMINPHQRWPLLQLVRYKGKPKGKGLHFGPYPNAYAARQTLDLLNKVFPLRQCSDRELAQRERPCLLYQIKRCCAPCVKKVTKEEYMDYVDQVVRFLKGQDGAVLEGLYADMQAASDRLDFEEAQRILNGIRAMEKTLEGQGVVKVGGADLDVLGIYREGGELVLTQMLYRGGRLTGVRSHEFSKIAQGDSELVESFLLQFYQDRDPLPREILIPSRLVSASVVEELLSEGKRRKTNLLYPQKGEKRSLVEMAQANAQQFFKKEKDESTLRERTLLSIQEKFHLTRYPQRMECFDNSNISGQQAVAAMVVFVDGKKEGKLYRKYKIKSVEGPDDYASMREVLHRRYKRAKEEGDLPDLIIVDGGKGQLNAALAILEELDISTVDVIGLAKEEGRHDRGMTAEQVFLPHRKDPLRLKSHSSELFLLQRIRDEAHRAALQFHKQQRSKTLVKSSLDQIPGIGPAKKKALLRHFGSVKKIRQATLEELKEVKELSKKDREKLRDFFL